MKQSGFTLVELLVVILIMGVLLTIGTISLRNNQVDSRDAERKTDVTNIMRSIEAFYDRNNGSYPRTTDMTSESSLMTTLPNLHVNSHRAPGITTGTSIAPATNATTTAAGVAPQPSLTRYVYQPLAGDGTLCTTTTQECRSYNIYYYSERESAPYILQGKNQ